MLNTMLNTVTIFGNELAGNGATINGLLIFAIVLLLGVIIALVFVLLAKIRKYSVQQKIVAQQEIEEEQIEKKSPEPTVEIQEELLVSDFDEESVEGGTLVYNRSFTAKYIQSDGDTKNYYVHLKNELLSYKKVHARMSWKRETFRLGKNVVARLAYRGKTLCIYLPLDPSQFAESKYHVEDASDIVAYADTPCLYRIRSERREKYAEELVATVMKEQGTVKIDRPFEDYYMPYEGVVQLIDKGLIKRVVRGSEAINKQQK